MGQPTTNCNRRFFDGFVRWPVGDIMCAIAKFEMGEKKLAKKNWRSLILKLAKKNWRSLILKLAKKNWRSLILKLTKKNWRSLILKLAKKKMAIANFEIGEKKLAIANFEMSRMDPHACATTTWYSSCGKDGG